MYTHALAASVSSPPPKSKVFPTAPMTRKVLDHLAMSGPDGLSAIEASDRFRCRALPRRIKDLKELGWNIRGEMRRDVTGQTYKRYFLIIG